MTIDPGLIDIRMAHGYMRADDILQARAAPRAADRTEARSFRGGQLQYSELMPEREYLRREVEPRANRDSNPT
jgi:hypothetical protein